MNTMHGHITNVDGAAGTAAVRFPGDETDTVITLSTVPLTVGDQVLLLRDGPAWIVIGVYGPIEEA